jgi:hypothetical protein
MNLKHFAAGEERDFAQRALAISLGPNFGLQDRQPLVKVDT